MSHFDIQHGDKRYTITIETFVIDEKPPVADVTITAIEDNDGSVWRLNPLMNFKGNASVKFVTDGFYKDLLDPSLLDKLETEIRNHLTGLKKLP
jgi:hypothetical protein